MGNQPTKQAQRRERREELQRRAQVQRVARQRRTILLVGVAVVVIAIAGIFIGKALLSGSSAPNSASANTVATVATGNTPDSNQPYPAIDNIQCNSQEQLNYHVHAHLSIYIDGKPVTVLPNIGIAPDGSCYYWLHTHYPDGVIHIESAQQASYKLGTFMRLWGQQFSQLGYPKQLDQSTGWKAYVDGKPYTGDLRQIELVAHRLITLTYNSPDAPIDTVYNWGNQ